MNDTTGRDEFVSQKQKSQGSDELEPPRGSYRPPAERRPGQAQRQLSSEPGTGEQVLSPGCVSCDDK